jgi:hypothetical protein
MSKKYRQAKPVCDGVRFLKTPAPPIFALALMLCLSVFTFAQETTGSIEITVKDPQGAVVPNASITVESSRAANAATTGFRRTVTTDDEGFQRVLQVPPGTYRVTVAATGGFAEKILDGVDVALGKTTPVAVDLGVAGAAATVNVTAEGESPIDPTDTKIQTNISQKDAELLPKGTNFASLLKVSPATRPEPASGGFQIDGASGSENTFIIDGQEVTNALSGTLDTNNNLPFQLVQEVQVKSSGFEAEYGGATGGVINVVTRGGNNDLRGEFGFQMRPGKLQPARRPILYLGDQVEYLRYNENNLGFYPTATFGGPVIKDRAWFFASYTPQIFTNNRTIAYREGSLAGQRVEYNSTRTAQYAFTRFDAQPANTLRLTGTFTYNPIVDKGELPLITTQFDPALPAGNGLTGAAYQRQLGGRQNALNTTGQAVWTPTGNLVLSLRGGYNFLNQKLNTYGRPDSTSVVYVLCSARGLTPPPSAGCNAGQSNGVATFSSTFFDATKRKTLDADATYITSLLGRHEFKGGYQLNALSNQVLTSTVDTIVLRYGRTIAETAGRSIPSSEGAIGAGFIQRFGTQGDVSSKNEGIYIQDKFQPTKRLTLNLGLRAERENVPSFVEGNPDLTFDFASKIAPRLGVAYDLTGDGKTKVSGFYGWFYDRFKYDLPRGNFGGDVYYDDYFEIFSNTPPAFQLNAAYLYGSGGPVNSPLGSCPSTGFVTGRIRCSINRRVPSNAGLPVNEAGGIDPNIKPYRQSELTFTFERELASKFVLQARYTRKRLDRAIEDVGFFNAQGSEVYIIGNPGEGFAKQAREDQGFRADKPVRHYDAFEIRLDRRFANNFYFNANYTLSRLYGNYSGLASSDEIIQYEAGAQGRTDPNASRYFDAPFTEAVVAGGETLGRLATDRPHVFKFAGAYSLDWNKRFGLGENNTTEFQTFFTAQSGTPLTTIADIAHYDTIIVNGRGDLGRTGAFTQTDFAIRHRYRFGRDSRFTLVAEMDILNLFNENNELGRYTLINPNTFALEDPVNGLVTQAEINAFRAQYPTSTGTGTSPQAAAAALRLAQQRFQKNGAPELLKNINAAADRDERFNQPNSFQAPREVRFGFRLLF